MARVLVVPWSIAATNSVNGAPLLPGYQYHSP
jgi:hypothetical protein